MTFPLVLMVKGGKGSGNWGHAGRPGKVGGSAPRDNMPPKEISGDGDLPFPETIEFSEAREIFSRFNSKDRERAIAIARALLVNTPGADSGAVAGRLVTLFVEPSLSDAKRRQFFTFFEEYKEFDLSANDAFRLLMHPNLYGDVTPDRLAMLRDEYDIAPHDAIGWLRAGFFVDDDSIAAGEIALRLGLQTDDARTIVRIGGNRAMEKFAANKASGLSDVASFYLSVDPTQNSSAAYKAASLAEEGGLSISKVAAALDKFGGINSDAVDDFFALSALTKSSPRLAMKMVNVLHDNGFSVKDIQGFTNFYSGAVGDGYRTQVAFIRRRDTSAYENPSMYDTLSDGGVEIVGSIYDRIRRRRIGTFSRTIKRKQDGAVDVWHNLLVLDVGTRGGGFGREYYNETEGKYLAAGIDNIRLHADLEIGGYAWARMGYDFADDKTKEKIVNGFKAAHIEKYGTPPSKSLAHSWEIASYKAPDGTPFGKDFMLKSNWWGIKRVDPDSDGWRVGVKYYQSSK